MKTVNSGQPNHPIVYITKGAEKSLEGLEVNPEQLNSFVREDMDYQRDITPRYVMYGRVKRSPLAGLHLPFTPFIFIQAPSSMQIYPKDKNRGLRETIVHETSHFVDSWDHPVRTAAECALRYAATIAAAKFVGLDSPETTGRLLFPYQAIGFYALRFSIYYRHLDPSERRARSREDDAWLVETAQEAIFIPESPSSVYDWAKEPAPYDWALDGE
jgi:hypothetical protein